MNLEDDLEQLYEYRHALGNDIAWMEDHGDQMPPEAWDNRMRNLLSELAEVEAEIEEKEQHR